MDSRVLNGRKYILTNTEKTTHKNKRIKNNDECSTKNKKKKTNNKL